MLRRSPLPFGQIKRRDKQETTAMDREEGMLHERGLSRLSVYSTLIHSVCVGVHALPAFTFFPLVDNESIDRVKSSTCIH